MSSIISGNYSQGGSQGVNMFGRLPFRIAGSLQNQLLMPLIQGLGIGGTGPGQQKFQKMFGDAQGPMAEVIRQMQGFLPGVESQAAEIGKGTAAKGSAAYQTLTSQIDNYLSQMPQFQQSAGNAVRDAYAGTTDSALYQDAAQKFLSTTRAGEAARGLESSGSAQAMEDQGISDLAYQFAANRGQMQQQALANYGQVGQMGQQAAGAGLDAVNTLQNLQQQQYMAPMQAIGGLLQMLLSGQAPMQQFLQSVSPQLGSFTDSGKDTFGAHY
jgi:hypothetical protein